MKIPTQDKAPFAPKIILTESDEIENSFRFWVNVNRDYLLFYN